jgi:hypothetical protein
MWGGSSETVSKPEFRAEGPTVNRPDRQVGIRFSEDMSAEGAAEVSVAPSAFGAHPEITFTPAWPFGLEEVD